MANPFRTANPALNEKAFQGQIAAGEAMTVQGTVNKTGLLLLCVVATSAWTWGLSHSPYPEDAIPWMMGGLLTMFFLIRAFHFHQHEAAEPPHVHSATCEPHAHHPPGQLSWMGVLLGMGIHTLLDGVALAASVAAESQHGKIGLWGFGTFLAVLLHKPLDTVSISLLMQAKQAPRRLQHAANFAFAALCPVGVALFFLGFSRFSDLQMTIVGCALAFSAGVFVCIALSDLLPEIEFHSHDRVKLSLALLLGVGAAYAIGFLEPEDAHEAGAPHAHVHEQSP